MHHSWCTVGSEGSCSHDSGLPSIMLVHMSATHQWLHLETFHSDLPQESLQRPPSGTQDTLRTVLSLTQNSVLFQSEYFAFSPPLIPESIKLQETFVRVTFRREMTSTSVLIHMTSNSGPFHGDK